MSDNRFYKSKWPPGDNSRNSRPKSFEKSSNSINTLLAYYESNSANGGTGASSSNDRINATSSPETGMVVAKPRQARQRTLSAGSSSSSDYSVESNSVDEHFSITSGDLDDAKSTYSSTTTSTNRTSTTQKRSNMPSVGGADRRRLAIVQMETLQEAMSASGTSSSESSLRSRRGISTNLAGLALVAPPDASSKTYTHLSPPNTAIIRIGGEKEEEEVRKYGQGHHRREGQHTPRGSDAEYKNSNLTDNKTAYHYERAVRSPSPTKLTHPPATTTATRPIPDPYEAQRAMLSPTSARGVDGHSALSSAFPSSTLSTPLITPDIGTGKEIHVPVAAPVIINLSASAAQPRPPIARGTTVATPPVQGPVHGVTGTTVFDPVKTSGFVNYKPGVHSTAGPLPPPPRLIDITSGLRTPPPPRPPRLHSPAPPKPRIEVEAMKQALQLPPAVAAKLAKTSPPLNASKDDSSSPERQDQAGSLKGFFDKADADPTSASLLSTRSTHRREGAFPSSPLIPQSESSSSSSLSTSTAAPTQFVSSPPRLTISDLKPPTRQPSVVGDDNDVPNVTVVGEEATSAAQEEDEEASSPTADAIEDLTKEENRDESRELSEHSGAEEGLSASRSTSSSMLSKHQRRISWTGSTNFSRHSRTPSGNSSWRGGVSLEDTGTSPKLSRSLSLSTSRSSKSSNNSAPSPPPKSFRNSLTTGLKRLSTLPKAPSLSASRSSRESRRSSTGTHYSTRSSRTPSPGPSHHHRVKRKRIVDPNPSAMFCHEVYQQRTAAERCAIYVTKINELYCYDCGLSDWLVEMKYRTHNPAPRGPTANPFVPKPRLTSRSSMGSEATFPRRPDAVVATDLSSHGHSSGGSQSDLNTPVSLSSNTASNLATALASSLPYPSLAAQSRQQSLRSASSLGSTPPSASIRSLTSSSHAPSSLKTGFFASLGRKASLQVTTKRAPTLASLKSNNAGSTSDHGHGGSHNGHGRNVPAKTAPIAIAKHEISRPVQITTNHSAPSGPRALHSSNPARVQRSLTMMPPPKSVIVDRDEAIGRRPSLFSISPNEHESVGSNGGSAASASAGFPAIDLDGEFSAQVDKLHALLPHADRTILAGYLKRAGQDVLAIGQYLEDEKNGTLRYF